MGLLKLLGLSTSHDAQHKPGKHTKSGQATQQAKPKPKKTKHPL